jgi:hypothetical protein
MLRELNFPFAAAKTHYLAPWRDHQPKNLQARFHHITNGYVRTIEGIAVRKQRL